MCDKWCNSNLENFHIAQYYFVCFVMKIFKRILFPALRFASQRQHNSFPRRKLWWRWSGVLIPPPALVKGYIDGGNFDGFLIYARKGLLRLRGPITDEKKERKLFFFFWVVHATWWGSVILICDSLATSSTAHITFSSSSIYESRSAPSTFLLYVEIWILNFITRDLILWPSYGLLIVAAWPQYGKDNRSEWDRKERM